MPRERLGTLNTGWAVFVVLSAGFPGPHVTFPLSVCKRGYCRWLSPRDGPALLLFPCPLSALRKTRKRKLPFAPVHWPSALWAAHPGMREAREALAPAVAAAGMLPGQPPPAAAVEAICNAPHPEAAPEACPLERVKTTRESPEEGGQESAPSWLRKGLGERSDATWTCRERWPGVLSISQ